MTQATNDQSVSLSALISTVSGWPGISTRPHRFGGTEFSLDGREIGHVHRSGIVDIVFPRRVRDLLVGAGNTGPHHIYPDSGWTTFRMTGPDALNRATWLLRLSYLYHAMAICRRPHSPPALDDFNPERELAAMDLEPTLATALGISGR